MNALLDSSFDEEDLEVIPWLFECIESENNENPFLSAAISGNNNDIETMMTGLSFPTEQKFEDRMMIDVSLLSDYGCGTMRQSKYLISQPSLFTRLRRSFGHLNRSHAMEMLVIHRPVLHHLPEKCLIQQDKMVEGIEGHKRLVASKSRTKVSSGQNIS